MNCDTLKGDVELEYDHLVLAFGNRARLDLIPGMAEHAVVLKTVGDAMHIRNLVLRRLAQIELETDPQLRLCLGHFVIVGGGFSGVEVAGAIADSLREIRHFYPRVGADELKVTLLQNNDRLLPELPASLGQAAKRSLMKRNVEVLTMTGASKVSARSIELAGRHQHRDDDLYHSARAQRLTMRFNAIATERRSIVCSADLSVAGVEGVWAIGDCAWIKNGEDGPAPPKQRNSLSRRPGIWRRILSHAARAARRPRSLTARAEA